MLQILASSFMTATRTEREGDRTRVPAAGRRGRRAEENAAPADAATVGERTS